MGSFFATPMKELVHDEDYATRDQTTASLFEYTERFTTASDATGPLPLRRSANPSGASAFHRRMRVRTRVGVSLTKRATAAAARGPSGRVSSHTIGQWAFYRALRQALYRRSISSAA